MKSREKQRTVAALRHALGQSQAEFAILTGKVSVVTMSRWEGAAPPKGDALLRLAKVARKRGQGPLADRFIELYLEDVMRALAGAGAPPGIDKRRADGSGFVVHRWRRDDAAAAAKILRACAARLEMEALDAKKTKG